MWICFHSTTSTTTGQQIDGMQTSAAGVTRTGGFEKQDFPKGFKLCVVIINGKKKTYVAERYRRTKENDSGT